MNRSSGYTVIELLVTVSILAIIVAFAAPSFSGLMRSIRVDGDLSSVRSALTLARSEAISQQNFITVCQSDDPSAAPANLECSDEADWASGWIVFVDTADNQQFDDASDEVIRIWDAPLSAGATLIDENDRTVVTFDQEGMLSENVDLLNLELVVSGCTGNQQRAIDVTLVGRLDISAEACP